MPLELSPPMVPRVLSCAQLSRRSNLTALRRRTDPHYDQSLFLIADARSGHSYQYRTYRGRLHRVFDVCKHTLLARPRYCRLHIVLYLRIELMLVNFSKGCIED